MDGVHTNMTTPEYTIEAFEITYPLLVEQYEFNPPPGTRSIPGGLGIVRTLKVLDHQAMVSLQSERRRFALTDSLEEQREKGRNYLIQGKERGLTPKFTVRLSLEKRFELKLRRRRLWPDGKEIDSPDRERPLGWEISEKDLPKTQEMKMIDIDLFFR